MNEVIGPPSYVTSPPPPSDYEISEDFESGLPDSSEGWSYYSDVVPGYDPQGRIDVNEVGSNWVLRMDDTTGNGIYSLNEAIMSFDYTDMTSATLTLDHWNKHEDIWGNESTSIPDFFTGSVNGDGIALSVDGEHWVKVTNLGYDDFTAELFNLTGKIEDAKTYAGSSDVSNVRIKIQQWDNYPVDPNGLGGDGREFDDIHVVLTGPGSTHPEMNCVIGTARLYEDITPPSSPATTRVYLNQNLPDEFDDEDQFVQPGFLYVSGQTFTIINSSGKPSGEDYVDVYDNSGDLRNGIYGYDYILYDDDYDRTVSPIAPHVTLPCTISLGSYMNIFDKAYISPTYLTTSHDDIVPFNRNLFEAEFEDLIDNGELWDLFFDNPPSSDFWSIHCIAGYQPDTGSDSDGETKMCGGYSTDNSNTFVIFTETIRENSLNEGKIMAHEIGHTGGLVSFPRIESLPPGHCGDPDCLMSEDGGSYLCDKCIKDLRNRTGF